MRRILIRWEMTSMSSTPCVLQFMHTDISRSWAGLVSYGGRATRRQPRAWSGTAEPRRPPRARPPLLALTLGFCSHISSLCTAISRTSL